MQARDPAAYQSIFPEEPIIMKSVVKPAKKSAAKKSAAKTSKLSPAKSVDRRSFKITHGSIYIGHDALGEPRYLRKGARVAVGVSGLTAVDIDHLLKQGAIKLLK